MLFQLTAAHQQSETTIQEYHIPPPPSVGPPPIPNILSLQSVPKQNRESSEETKEWEGEEKVEAAPVQEPVSIIPMHHAVPGLLGRPQPWDLTDSNLVYEFQTSRLASDAYHARRYSGSSSVTYEDRQVAGVMYTRYYKLQMLYRREIKARVNAGAFIPKNAIYTGIYRDDEYLEPNFGPPNWPPPPSP